MDIEDVLEAIWQRCPVKEEAAAKEWMRNTLRGDLLIFDDDSDVRAWALKNTDLVEPEE